MISLKKLSNDLDLLYSLYIRDKETVNFIVMNSMGYNQLNIQAYCEYIQYHLFNSFGYILSIDYIEKDVYIQELIKKTAKRFMEA